jgi:hypothetical protein
MSHLVSRPTGWSRERDSAHTTLVAVSTRLFVMALPLGVATIVSALTLVQTSRMPLVARRPGPGAADLFEEAIGICEQCLAGDETSPLHEVPRLMDSLFDDDFERLQERSTREVQNVTCMCPCPGTDGQQLFGDELLEFRVLSTRPGRQCQGGDCGSACSRVSIKGLATQEEARTLQQRANALMDTAARKPVGTGETNLEVTACAQAGDARTTLLLLRLIERLRRCVALEYGVPLDRLHANYGFVNRIDADGGALHSSYGIIHADESSDSGYHYSGVLQLGTQGEHGFEGGDFAFTDPIDADEAAALEAALNDAMDEEYEQSRGGGGGATPQQEGEEASALSMDDGEREMRAAMIASALLTAQNQQRFATERGRALIFSSGWENVHFVDAVTSGVRFVLPVFFGMGPPRPRTQPTAGGEESKCSPAGESVASELGAEADQQEEEAVGSRLPSVEEVCAMWATASASL